MGKAFNNDIFGNTDITASINGLSISKEAIEENKKENEPSIDLKKLNIDTSKIKKAIEENQKEKEQDRIKEIFKEKLGKPQDDEEKKRQQQEEILERVKVIEEREQQEALNNTDNAIYTKKTMIFKQEYLDIIDGLAELNNMQIKDVLNQLLEKSINQLDEKVRDKALKTGKKTKTVKTSKNIF